MAKSTHTADYRRLCRALKDIRTDAGLSQRELAEKLRVPHSWVSKVETGERRLDVVEFVWVCKACGVDSNCVFARFNRGKKL